MEMKIYMHHRDPLRYLGICNGGLRNKVFFFESYAEVSYKTV